MKHVCLYHPFCCYQLIPSNCKPRETYPQDPKESTVKWQLPCPLLPPQESHLGWINLNSNQPNTMVFLLFFQCINLFPPGATILAATITWNCHQNYLSVLLSDTCSKIISKMPSNSTIPITSYFLDWFVFSLLHLSLLPGNVVYKHLPYDLYRLPCNLYEARAFVFLSHCSIPNA